MKRAGMAPCRGVAGSAGLLYYMYSNGDQSRQPETSVTNAATTQMAAGTTTPPGGGGGVTNTPLAPPTTAGDVVASGLEFNWPGDDCWDIFRGAEHVTHKCGTNAQALGAGTYTIKGKYAPVFVPFDVFIKAGTPTRITMGGVLDFKWPGDDCWDIFRGDERVTHKCGANTQALAAGEYTVKGKYAPVFLPFAVEIKNGSSTRIDAGGVFTFNWPGDDCWDVVRGAEVVTHKCGTNAQALGAGTYDRKARAGIQPFTIKVSDGARSKPRNFGGGIRPPSRFALWRDPS
jgi:hypothetical protein